MKVNLRSGYDIWYHESLKDIFVASLSWKRFSFLVWFDDKTTRPERWNLDRLACIRDIFQDINKRNASVRYPLPFLAVDETLYPYRGRIGIKQYNPTKPAKYGLLYRSLCNAVVPYTYFTHPYSGKPSQINEESWKYYVKWTDEYTKYLVNGTSEYTSFSGCNISLDQYFNSISLAIWAIEKGLTLVGTMQLDRKGIPKEIKS